MAAAHSKVSVLVFQLNVSLLPSPVFLESKGRDKTEGLKSQLWSHKGEAQKLLLSREEAPFIVSRWEGEAVVGGILLRAALMLACLFAFFFLNLKPKS